MSLPIHRSLPALPANYPHLSTLTHQQIHLSTCPLLHPNCLSTPPCQHTVPMPIHLPAPCTQPPLGPCSLSSLYPLYSEFCHLCQCTKDTRSSHTLLSACPKLSRAALGMPTHEATGVSHPRPSAPAWCPDTSRNVSSYRSHCGQVGHVLVAAVTHLELPGERREQELCWGGWSVCLLTSSGRLGEAATFPESRTKSLFPGVCPKEESKPGPASLDTGVLLVPCAPGLLSTIPIFSVKIPRSSELDLSGLPLLNPRMERSICWVFGTIHKLPWELLAHPEAPTM